MTRHRLAEGAAALLILGVYVALAVHSLRQKSATFDEPPHLAAGYTYWRLGDFRLNLEHPPLVKRLAAAPLLLTDVTIETDTRPWVRAKQWDFGRAFLYQWNDGDPLLHRGRLVVVALGVLLLLAVYGWSRRRTGAAAGLLSLVLCAFSPDVLAHGQLVTTDLGAALFVLATIAAFALVLERATPARVIGAGASLGALVATKFSGVAVLPILVAIAGIAAWDEPAGVRARRFRRLLAVIAAMSLLALAVIWAAYGFRASIADDAAVPSVDWDGVRPQSPVFARAADVVRASHVLPEAYVYGFLMFRHHAQERPAFLNGDLSRQGWPHYFLVTFLLKTPLPLLLLLALLAAPPWRRPETWTHAALVWIPVAAYAAFALTSRLNIGHRHLLPLYPFLFVAAGALAVHPDRWRRLAAGVAAAASVVVALRIHPDHLSYFNALAGGPSQGYRYLVDSNLDWGQDLKRLKAYLDANGIETVKLSYFGPADPEYYGIRCERLPGHPPPKEVAGVAPGDVVAVSATHLQGVYLERDERRLMRLLRERTPIGRVGYSIFIYRADFAWSPRP
jgi:hypothetical protein